MRFNQNIDYSHDTVQRLLSSAEKLFARHGQDHVSLRELTSDAGVNLAAVNYHFGSKEALAEGVFERLLTRICSERGKKLMAIEDAADAAGHPPDLKAIIESFIEAYFSEENAEQGRLLAQFLLKHRLNPSNSTRRVIEAHLNPSARDYIKLLQRACPDIPPLEIYWRYLYMAHALTLTATDDKAYDRIAMLSGDKITAADHSFKRKSVVNFLLSAFTSRGDISADV